MNNNKILASYIIFLSILPNLLSHSNEPLKIQGEPLGLMYAPTENNRVTYLARTQEGEVLTEIAVLKIKSKMGSGNNYYITKIYSKYYPPQIIKVMTNTNKAMIKKVNDHIYVMSHQGANTTILDIFSIESGLCEHKETKAVRWNGMINDDSGYSNDYEYFINLFNW